MKNVNNLTDIYSKEIGDKLEQYHTLIEEWNKIINLTGFSGPKLWSEGIDESIQSLKEFKIKGTLIDIGAGAGFPSVPLKITNPDIKLTIIEPLQKRVKFLEEVNSKLQLDISFINNRAEKTYGVKGDFITARAVAPLYKLIEISFDLGNIGSQFIFIKGPNIDKEIKDAANIIEKLEIKYKVVTKIIHNKHINIFYFIKEIATPSGIPRNWLKIKI